MTCTSQFYKKKYDGKLAYVYNNIYIQKNKEYSTPTNLTNNLVQDGNAHEKRLVL